jgi:hypothetical protein
MPAYFRLRVTLPTGTARPSALKCSDALGATGSLGRMSASAARNVGPPSVPASHTTSGRVFPATHRSSTSSGTPAAPANHAGLGATMVANETIGWSVVTSISKAVRPGARFDDLSGALRASLPGDAAAANGLESLHT